MLSAEGSGPPEQRTSRDRFLIHREEEATMQALAECEYNRTKYVTQEPLVLYNRKKVPIYHFVFASQNEIACKVAQYIITKKNNHGIKD